MGERRAGTVTFLFTDIEGSTMLVKRLRERWPGVRSAHRRIVREAFSAHGGQVLLSEATAAELRDEEVAGVGCAT